MRSAEVIARVVTSRGELVLRRVTGPDGEHLEIISNGTFLMDTRDGRSERLLAQSALAAATSRQHVLVGGLGVGFTLEEVLVEPLVERVTVVELEPTIIEWYAGEIGHALADPRVTVVTGDLVDVIADETSTYDVICLDVDNGPGWTVTEDNRRLYTRAGTELLRSRINDGGALGVWSAHASPAYEGLLREVFGNVATHPVEVERGEPDVVYVSRR